MIQFKQKQKSLTKLQFDFFPHGFATCLLTERVNDMVCI